MGAKLALSGLVLALVVAVYFGGKAMKVEKSKVLETVDPRALLTADPPMPETDDPPVLETTDPPPAGMAYATFASGCFWCTEAVFQQLKGVQSVVSGYSGGSVKNPTYKQVCTGRTGHAEAIQITYDPKVISFKELLEVFWQAHDPTTLNQQGNDVGTQYRSAIFYHSDEQKNLAEHYKKKLDESGIYPAPIVTEVVPFTAFYKAETYHQNFFEENPMQPYCRMIIRPKLDKIKKVFADKLKQTATE